MDDFRNPMYAAEPYEESQGKESLATASPNDLAAFYRDMERKEIIERKLSKRKSGSGTSIWSRKSLKRSGTTSGSVPPPSQNPQQHKLDLEASSVNLKKEDEVKELEKEQLMEKPDWVPPPNSPRSIIPDTMKELPAWYNKDTWASVALSSSKLVRYNIHDPLGPRWYKNHHLIPSSQVRSNARPPSVFSPFFPPITSSASQERPEDSTRMAGLSRTPSNSPLPTPNSSQTRVEDATSKPRSRKTSQTAHDNVDLLDVTDPWGTNWHHQSPYDIGLGNGPVSIDVQDALNTRSRRSSMTAQSRHKTVAPSPLSQSTSAVHLHVPDVGSAHVPRKLSKRRTPAVGSIFGGHESGRNAISLPATPVEQVPGSTNDFQKSELPKRMSVAPAQGPTLNMQPQVPSKKEKRGSVLGRLVKKFSIMRKAVPDHQRENGKEDDWQQGSTDDAGAGSQRPSVTLTRPPPAPEKLQHDATKRVPPPSVDQFSVNAHEGARERDRSSSISLEAPFSIGRLTIANPDAPGSTDNTPVQDEIPLPSESIQHNHNVNNISLIHPEPPPTTALTSPPEIQPPPLLPEKISMPPSHKAAKSIPPPDAQRLRSELASPSSPPKADGPSSEPLATSRPDPNLPKLPSEQSYSTPHSPRNVGSSQGQTQSADARSHRPPKRASTAPATTRPSYIPLSVPFPAVEHGNYSLADEMHAYDHSPLSAASMLANPPTPHTNGISMPSTPENPVPFLPQTTQDKKRSSRETSPHSQATRRQTETFKLVRSSSGNVYASSETIVAGGQQWEVVESSENKGKGRSSTKPKDQDANSRRDPKRDGREKPDADADIDQRSRNRSQRNQKPQSGERSTQTPKATRSNSTGPQPQPPAVDRDRDSVTRQDVSRSSHRREGDKDRKSDRKNTEKSPSTTLNINKPQPPPPPPTPGPSARPLQRNPSISARPTSELPSAAEMNALRAKEAWDMERLWKARSMYGDGTNEFKTTLAAINTPASVTNDDLAAQSAAHGSSHTAFVVQTPFQGHSSHIYHSMPNAPPSIVYSSSPSIPGSSHITPAHSHSNFPSIPDALSDKQPFASTLRPTLANPLPEPPRESTYEPALLPGDIIDRRSGTSAEHWIKYTGVTAAH